MAQSQDKPGDGSVDPRWEQTLQNNTDAKQSIHVRPPASEHDVAELSKTLQTTSFLGLTGQHAPKTGAPAAERPAGVSGQDFFAFKDLLGHGGMGMVYDSVQRSMSREVAVKTLRSDALNDPSTTTAFLREALTTGALTHPNIVPVHFFGRDEQGQPFMVMKRVQGRPWNELLVASSGEFDLRLHLDIFLKVCDAVAFAHAHDIVHRDLKPGNVMIGDYGEVMLMDWGLAFDVSPQGDRGLAMPKSQAAAIAGTPAYMAPEMVRCEVDKLGPATDIYLLGGILWEIITSKPPHFGKDVYEVLAHAASGKLDRLSPRPGLERECRGLEEIIRTAMATQPADRYPNVAALQAQVRAFLAGQGDREESEALTEAGRVELAALATEVEDLLVTSPYYARATEIVNKAQKALTLWRLNPRAVRVWQEALALFAELAVRGKDWGLAETMLRDLKASGSGGHALAVPIEARLRTQREKVRMRDYVVQRMARLAAIATVLMAGLSIFLYWQLRHVEDKLAVAEAAAPRTEAPPELPDANLATQPLDAQALPPEHATTDTDPKSKPAPVAVQVVHAGQQFAPQMLAPFNLPRDKNNDVFSAGGASPLKQMLCSPTGQLLMWDQSGAAWHWNSVLAPATIRDLGLMKSRGVVSAAWIEGSSVLVALANGELLSNTLPAGPRDAMRPWQSVAKAEGAARALAVRLQGLDLAVAVGTDKEVRESLPGKDARVHALNAPVLCLQYLPNGTLIAVTQKAIHAWRETGQEVRYGLAEEATMAMIARAAPVVVLAPASGKDELQIFNLDLETGKGSCTSSSKLFEKAVTCLTLSPDGKRLAAGSAAGELLLMGGSPWKLLSVGKTPSPPVHVIEFNFDGSVIYSSDAGGLVYAWNVMLLK